jgi:glycerol uptake facilitator-like aquaporin
MAHLMFEAPVFELSAKLRDGPAQAFSEFVATFGLIGTIAGAIRYRAAWTPALVGLYISAAYWFTASTSFANPAVTVARALSDSFAGIAPHSVPWFLLAQLAGAATAYVAFGWLFDSPGQDIPSATTPRP